MKTNGLASFVALAALLLAGCEHIDHATRPSAAYSTFASGYSVKVGASSLEVRCVRNEGDRRSSTGEDRPCEFKTVVEAGLIDSPTTPAPGKSIVETLSEAKCLDTCMAERELVVALLLKVSDENCSSFLQHLFLTKSTSDSGYAFGRDLLTGGTAAAAIPSPPAAIGMSFASLLLRSYEAINDNFFLNSAYQSIESAILLEREARLKVLNDTCRADSPLAGRWKCPVLESMRLVKQYDDACTLRAGVSKLQALVHTEENRQQNSQLAQKIESLNTKAAVLEARNDTLNKLDFSERLTIIQNTLAELLREKQEKENGGTTTSPTSTQQGQTE